MKNDELVLLDHFTQVRDNKIIDKFQLLVSEDSIYFVNSNTNYSDYVKSLFSGLGEAMNLFGNSIGVVGGLISELTGHKLSKVLKEYSEKSSNKNMEKLKANLNKMSLDKKGILKMDFGFIDSIEVKKNLLINGKSFVKFKQEGMVKEFFPKNNEVLNDLINTIKIFGYKDKIESRLF